MKNRKSELSMLQSYRMYAGGRLLTSFLIFSIGEILMYLFCVFFAFIMNAWSDGHSFVDVFNNLASNLSQKDNLDPHSWIFAISLATGIILIRQFDKSNPGGKFFRTVKGGFETYKKYQIVVYMTILSSAVLCATVAFLLDHFGIIALKGGIASSVACVTSVVYALTIFSIANRFKNKISSSAISILTVSFCSGIFGDRTLLERGDVNIFIILLVIGLILLPLSMRLYFSFYKRECWD